MEGPEPLTGGSQGVPVQRVSVEMPIAIAGSESRGRGGWRVGAATWPW